MEKNLVIKGLLYSILSLIALSVFMVYCIPFSVWFPSGGLDASWVISLNQAITQHLAFGKDIIFTYGPYAMTITHQYTPTTDFLALLGGIYLCSCFFIAFILTLKKETFLSSILFILAFPFIGVDVLLFAYPFTVALSLATLVKTVQENKMNPLIAFPCIAILFSGFGLIILIKGSVIASCMITLILSMVLCCSYKKIGFAITAFLSSIISTLIFWKIAGQNVSLVDHFKNLIPIISGYSDAMSFTGNPSESKRFVITALLMLTSILTQKNRELRSKYFLLVCFALFLFISFKEGFVRHDEHALVAVSGLIIGIPYLLFMTSLKRPLVIISLCMALISIRFIAHDHNMSIRQKFFGIKNDYIHAIEGFSSRFKAPQYLPNQYNEAIARLKQEARFPIYKGTTDIYPFEQAWLIASGNHWSPRPIFQSYSAYTPQLAEMNKAYLVGPNRPNHIIFKVATIDNRFPALDDGASWPVLLSLYAPDTLKNDFLYLHEKENCRFIERNSLIFSKEEKMRQWLKLPETNHPLFAKINLQLSFIGKMEALLYKPPHLRITLLLNDSSERQYRMVAGMAASGFLLSPLIENTADFAQLYHDSSPLLKDKRIKAIKISVGRKKSGLFWQDHYTISLSEINSQESVQCQS